MLASSSSPSQAAPVGTLLREWRQRRHWSQFELADEAGLSTRHLSCLETGRALPSRQMLLRLTERLQVPLRERNRLFTAAGYAPMYAERALGDPALQAAHDAVQRVLQAHEPYPALAVDRHWQLLSANRAIAPLLAGVAPELLASPVNVLRLSLHPGGLAPRIANLPAWRSHLLARLAQQIQASGDPVLAALADELRAYPCPADDEPHAAPGIAVPLQLNTPAGLLSFISTTTVFGTPVDITLSELAIEAFFPADAQTAQALQALMAAETPPTPGTTTR
ncbi:helix-turn-helix transcriptional regulator [Ideonella azotifigens]|uniref:Helix-turn-helix transcriptional regulator n=2 Tax=Ideonella azotifigens TaxID=513160 RepID=A0ABN1JRV8_9BURK|nr:helix-turn-helix transcriptional regulator [Ideonella azotifigens]MCD2340845.1 helix-turn-helix transcriptional regulator [Ideonella azotifigens]